MLTRSKVQGMIVGGAIGDALGRPVESMSFEQSCKNYPKGISCYVAPNKNKWFKDQKTGVITDDTQLTVVTMKALIRAKGIEMDTLAKYHIMAMAETDEGWGGSTREAVIRLMDGASWKDSGKTSTPNRGMGNGSAMKVSPLAAWHASGARPMKWFRFAEQVTAISAMTHYTRASARASVMHAMILEYLLWSDVSRYTRTDFYQTMLQGLDGRAHKRNKHNRGHYYVGHLENPEGGAELMYNLLRLPLLVENWSIQELIARYKNGNSNVVNSLPFSYAFFLRNPHSIETLYNVARAGGDSDTNAKFVGEMIGALHGIEFFQTDQNVHLLKGLKCCDSLVKLTNVFCDTFGIK